MGLRGLLIALAIVAIHATAGATEPGGPRVGVLLPVEGENRPIGQRTLRSIAMAAEFFDGVVWRTYDTSGGAEAAYRAAAAEGVQVVLGPVGETESRDVIAVADEVGVPVLLLSGVDRIEDPAAGVFRLRTNAADQAYALGGVAVSGVVSGEDHRLFAVVAPESAWADEAVTAFVASIVDHGGIVTHVVRYPEDSPDFSEVAAELAGHRTRRLQVPGTPWRADARAMRRAEDGDLRRPDAIAIFDYDDVVADMLPFLEFAGWVGDRAEMPVAVFGLSTWNGPRLELVGDLAAGARLTAPFAPGDPRAAADTYALEYSMRYAEEASEFDAQIFDAAAWAFSFVDSLADAEVATAAAALPGGHAWSGACGTLELDANGGPVRELTLWEVDGRGAIFPVAELNADGSLR